MSLNSASKVIVGMSGGVDSSVAALLLLEQGYRVEGLFMKNWEEDDGTEYCTAKQDFADAQAVADSLGIALHGANFAAEYWDNVFAHFLAEYRAGRTPNPDILCNREIKFKAFLEYAQLLGADYIATGHYARRGASAGQGTLLKGLDDNKDQSYFLHAVGHRELEQTLFPLGELPKPEVRRLAAQHQLATARKKDSTGICFIGERRFRDFLQQYLPAQPGEIHSLQGEYLGQHSGLMYHTIGQRQGLGIGGLANHDDAPWYVVDKDLAHNVLLVAQGNDHPALFKSSLYTGAPLWVAGAAPELPLPCRAKVRYRQPDQACSIQPSGDGLRVLFEQPQRAVTPGQSVVFYQGERCLGGAVIERAAP
ncbi:MAG: tRNA 2-thiouridine(34) synthase MnmA [Pseudomonadales bacterium]|nr:tRNA 2-thiouridine(34) synthase MnmA [Halieaceae bacterium]MCP5164748.1 tRNA 2-thiouridine(34) synthase MnmA [Pseudomonadales bacterium]MCP5188863.1 tRNA 2-thiouridine(34) synthase MnmA [Pseudomonadales bacterium]MCP5203150.1 tRNA 2-thiouridine(34) synthase MnmA [Pseudomonadales bacterium]